MVLLLLFSLRWRNDYHADFFLKENEKWIKFVSQFINKAEDLATLSQETAADLARIMRYHFSYLLDLTIHPRKIPFYTRYLQFNSFHGSTYIFININYPLLSKR